MMDLKALHQKLCPTKCLNNFWKSADYAASHAALTHADVPESKVRTTSKSARGHPSSTMVHPIVGLAFMRWAAPELFYTRLRRIVEE